MRRALVSRRDVLKDMLLRPQYARYRNLHPAAVKRLMQRTQTPAALQYKLHEADAVQSLSLPHQAPLGLKDSSASFSVERTNSGNLPVYIDYKNERNVKRTVIRKVSGDIDAFCDELKKVVSNYDIKQKVGRVEIPGVHRESVNTWLLRMGF